MSTPCKIIYAQIDEIARHENRFGLLPLPLPLVRLFLFERLLVRSARDHFTIITVRFVRCSGGQTGGRTVCLSARPPFACFVGPVCRSACSQHNVFAARAPYQAQDRVLGEWARSHPKGMEGRASCVAGGLVSALFARLSVGRSVPPRRAVPCRPALDRSFTALMNSARDRRLC